MTNVVISKSNKKRKKYDAVIDGKKTISFGATGYSDFTKHKDEERKQKYIDRHKKNEDWTDFNTAGFWARWLIWEEKTIPEAINKIERKFNMKIKNKI